MQILLIGASGYLGRHIYRNLKGGHRKVIGTYCMHQTEKGLIPFDINRDDVESVREFFSEKSDCAVLCAAESKYDACKDYQKESFQTNVTSTIRLIEKLKQKNYYILFCSTDSVYDGMRGYYKEDDPTEPVNEYGKMKLQVERYITEYCPNACIFRLSKMFGDVNSTRDTFREWKKMAEDKKDIYCIKDNYFSPVDVEDVARCVEIACDKKLQGIYNICGNDIYSRADLCLSFLQSLNLETNIYEKNLEEFGFSDLRPLNVGMSNQKAVHALEYKFKSIQEVYKRYIDVKEKRDLSK